MGKINSFTDGLAVSLSAQADASLFPAPFPSLPAELVPQMMPPHSLPPSTAQQGSSLPTLLTPLATRAQNASSHRAQCWQKQDFPKHSYSPFPSPPLEKYQSKHFVIISGHSFLPITAYLQCSVEAPPGR